MQFMPFLRPIFSKRQNFWIQIPIDNLRPNGIFLITNEISEALLAIFLKKQFKNLKKIIFKEKMGFFQLPQCSASTPDCFI